MTGDESYHADCFTCRQCARRIEELVFAKTSQGIYCMACHNERVARSRRHAEAKQRAKAKKEREKEREREREKDKATVTPGEVEKDRRVETEKPHDKPQDKSQDVVDKPPDKRQVDTDKPLPVPSPTLSSMSTPGELTTTSRSRLSPGPVGPRQRPPVDHSLSASRNRSTGSRSTTPTTPRMGEDNDHHGKPAERSTTGDIDIDYYAGEPALPPVHQTPHVHPQATGAIHNGPVTQPLNDTLGKKPRSPSPLPHSPLWPSSSTSSSSHHPTSTTVSQNGDHADNDDDTIKEKTVYKLPPPQTHSSQQPQKPSHDDAPYLTAPSLSTIGFSLSDPDFAKLLAENKASPEKTRQALAARAAAAAAASATSTTSHENQTSSPTKLSSKHQLSPSCLSEPNGSSNPSVPHSPLPAPSAATMQQATIVTPKNPSVRPTRSDSLKSLDKPHPNLPVAEPPSPPLHVDSTLSALLAIQSSQLDNNAVSIPRGLLDRTITELQTLHASITELKSKYSGAHRTSLHYMQGMNVAAEEYEKAVQQRTEAENQVARLKTQLHGQTARMSLIKEDEQRQETLKRQSNDLATSLSGLERDVTRLRVERDIALVEVEQLTAAREASSDTQTQATLTRSLAHRLETIKDEYTSRLGPLETQRQQITRDLAELRDTRNLYIEEATALSAKNEQLAELNVRLVKQTEAMQEGLAAAAATAANSNNNHFNARPPRASSAYLRPGLNRYHPQHISGSPSMSSIATTTSSTLHEGIVSGGSESTAGLNNVNQSSSNTNTTNAPSSSGPRRFKWYKSSKGSSTTGEPSALAHSIISRPLAVPTTQGGASAASSSTAASSTTDLQARLSNDSHLPLSSATHNNGNTIHNNNNNAQEHVFHPTSILRFSKCEHCGDKMWGLQEVRCAVCGVYCHTKCMDKLAAGGGPSAQCLGSSVASHLTRDPAGGAPGAADLSSLSPLMSSTGPSLIGRDLAEQARRDGQPVPVIVTKCIDAVETQGECLFVVVDGHLCIPNLF